MPRPERCVFFSYHDGGNGLFFEKGLCAAVRSVRRSNPELPVFLLHDGLSSGQQSQLAGCTPVLVDSSPFKEGGRPDLTVGAYFKLYAGKLAEFGQALYLDSDLVVLDRLDGLFAADGWLAARRERYDLAHEYREPDAVRQAEGLSDGSSMMNSGVVLFDAPLWEREKLLERSLEIGRQYGWDSFRNADQGILNILARRRGGFRELPVVYNFCRWPDMEFGQGARPGLNALKLRAPFVLEGWRRRAVRLGFRPQWLGAPLAKIVHWNGPVKPWRFRDSGEDAEKYFLECYEQFA